MSKQKEFGFGSGGHFADIGPRCHEGHKPLKLGKGWIFGGSCLEPRAGFDIYIGFDRGVRPIKASFPWEEKPVISFLYPISDMRAPSDPASFMKMVDWICTQLHAGKKIHMGCIGGHGRTGTVLAAVYAKMHPEDPKAIQWARERHCYKAVESMEQVNFLMKYFGVAKASGTKEGKKSKGKSASVLGFHVTPSYGTSDSTPRGNSVSPVNSRKSIWTHRG